MDCSCARFWFFASLILIALLEIPLIIFAFIYWIIYLAGASVSICAVTLAFNLTLLMAMDYERHLLPYMYWIYIVYSVLTMIVYAVFIYPLAEFIINNENFHDMIGKPENLATNVASVPIILIALILLFKLLLLFFLIRLITGGFTLYDMGFLPHDHPRYKPLVTCKNFCLIFMGFLCILGICVLAAAAGSGGGNANCSGGNTGGCYCGSCGSSSKKKEETQDVAYAV